MRSFFADALLARILEGNRSGSPIAAIPLGTVVREFEKVFFHQNHQASEVMTVLGSRIKELDEIEQGAIDVGADGEVSREIQALRERMNRLAAKIYASREEMLHVQALLEESAWKHQSITIVQLHVGQVLWFWRGQGHISPASRGSVHDASSPPSATLGYVVMVFRAPTLGQLARVERVSPRSISLPPNVARSMFTSAQHYWAQVEENMDAFAAQLTGGFTPIPMDPSFEALVAAPGGLRVLRRLGSVARTKQGKDAKDVSHYTFDAGAGPARGIKIALVDRIEAV